MIWNDWKSASVMNEKVWRNNLSPWVDETKKLCHPKLFLNGNFFIYENETDKSGMILVKLLVN